MLRRHRLLVTRLLVYFDAILVLLSYAIGVRFRDRLSPEFANPFIRDELFHFLLALVAVALILLGYKLAGLYHSQRMASVISEIGRLVLVNLAVYLLLLAPLIAVVFSNEVKVKQGSLPAVEEASQSSPEQLTQALLQELGRSLDAETIAEIQAALPGAMRSALSSAAGPDQTKKPIGNFIQLCLFSAVNTVLVVVVRVVLRTLAHFFRRRGYNYRHLVILANPSHDPSQLLGKIIEHDWWGYRVLAVVTDRESAGGAPPAWNGHPLPGDPPVLSLAESTKLLDTDPVDEVWVDGVPDEQFDLYELVSAATDQGVTLRYILPRNFFPGVRWGFETFDNITTLAAARTPMDDLARIGKRAMDLGLSSIALALAGPVMLVVSVLLAFEKGGVLFRQKRVGLNGRIFTCYKFRTMVPDAEARKKELEKFNEMGGPVFKMKRDPRITRLGYWLRKFSLDELPQLFNVLKGDMSLVGPRPPIPSEVNQYERTQKRRLSVKPGITGLWQVSGRNEISSFEDWVRLDLEYIDQWSLKLDLKILLRTIPAVLRAKGAR